MVLKVAVGVLSYLRPNNMENGTSGNCMGNLDGMKQKSFEGKCSRMSSLVNTIELWIKQSSAGDSCLGLEFDFNVVPSGYILKEVRNFDLLSSWPVVTWYKWGLHQETQSFGIGGTIKDDKGYFI